MYCIPNIGQGRSGFSFKDHCFDNLVKYNISAFWGHYELAPFYGTPAVELLVYFDFKEAKILRTISMLAAGDMVSRYQAQCLIPAGATDIYWTCENT